jgi:hypothetical protein
VLISFDSTMKSNISVGPADRPPLVPARQPAGGDAAAHPRGRSLLHHAALALGRRPPARLLELPDPDWLE